MEKWYSKFRRGDVWFLHFNSEDGDGRDASSVEKKSRPYLIVSCEENNMNAPIFNVIPITTRNNDHLPMHVFFVYQDGTPNGRNQLVLCEQITTVSKLVFNHPQSRFMYSFDLAFMNKIDEALTRQLGLKPRVADMKIIERLIEELASKKEAELQKAKEMEIQQRVENIVESLAKRFGIDLSSDVLQNNQEYRSEELRLVDRETVSDMRKTAAQRRSRAAVEPVLHKSAKEQMTSESKNRPNGSKRTKWTPELKREFIDDYGRLSISAISSKWGLTKKSIQQTAWKFKKELGVSDTQ